MIRGQNLPAITQIADSDVLIVDSASGGTRKITYAQLCQAVKQTLGIREVIDSVNITEDGYLMGGKVIADELAKLNDDIESTQSDLKNQHIFIFNTQFQFSNGIATFSKDLSNEFSAIGFVGVMTDGYIEPMACAVTSGNVSNHTIRITCGATNSLINGHIVYIGVEK